MERYSLLQIWDNLARNGSFGYCMRGWYFKLTPRGEQYLLDDLSKLTGLERDVVRQELERISAGYFVEDIPFFAFEGPFFENPMQIAETLYERLRRYG